MSAKLQLGVHFTVLIVVILMGVISLTTSFQNSNDIAEQKRLTLEGRQIGNQRGNLTMQLFGTVLTHIDNAVTQIQGNLTDHRIVTNDTRDNYIIPLINKTQTLIKSFNMTNESGRGKAVEDIINTLHEDHEIIMKGLNITATDTNTESFDAIQKLKKQLDQLELSSNESKRSQTK